jgi:2-methylcitrate dehydratase PrpD
MAARNVKNQRWLRTIEKLPWGPFAAQQDTTTWGAPAAGYATNMSLIAYSRQANTNHSESRSFVVCGTGFAGVLIRGGEPDHWRSQCHTWLIAEDTNGLCQ